MRSRREDTRVAGDLHRYMDAADLQATVGTFHRVLRPGGVAVSDYWKAFKAAGFVVEDFEEPGVGYPQALARLDLDGEEAVWRSR